MAPGSATAPRLNPSDFPSDEALVPRVLAGERDLFEVLIRRNNPRVYRALRGLLHDEDEIEEAMQQAYVQAFTKLGQFSFGARFSTWLIRIAVNEVLQKLRKQRFRAVHEVETMNSTAPRREDPEGQAADRELVRLMESLIDELPENYRSVLILREVEGLSAAETGAALELSEDVVKQRLFRARQQLKQRLEEKSGQGLSDVFPFHAPRCDRVTAGALRRILALGSP